MSKGAEYSDLYTPRESAVVADADFNAFAKAVEKARAKYRIANVTIIAQLSVLAAGHEGRIAYACHIGERSKMLEMLAGAFGYEQAEHQHALVATVARARDGGVGRRIQGN